MGVTPLINRERQQNVFLPEVRPRIRRSWLMYAAVMFAALTWASEARAQAQVGGRVTDPAGAVLPGVQVSLTPANAQQPVATVKTDATGDFSFQRLSAGTYVVRATAEGFQSTDRRVTVNTAGRARLDLQLRLAVQEQITVLGSASRDSLPLDVPSEAGSRLGLTAREVPASLEIVPQAVMQERGQRTVEEAVESAVGVTVGDSPGNMANFSTRGFTNNQVSVLHDGLKIGPPSMVGRPMDVWNLERVEVLKGPASALFGEGAVGAAINYVFKRPDHLAQRAEAQVSYGGFNTMRVGVGAGGGLGHGVHYRADYGLNHSDGFIDRTPSTLHSLTSAIAWDAASRVSLQLSFDVLRDDISPYWGTPLVPASFAKDPIDGVVRTADGQTIERRMSRVNYNVSDSVMDSTTYVTRAKGEWRPASGLFVRNEFYYLKANRAWKNSETYAFNSTTKVIDRDRFVVAHDQSIIGDRVELHADHAVGGHANRFLAGFDVNALDFVRPSFFSDGDTADPFNPSPGLFGAFVSANQTANIDTAAFFAEDYFAIRSNLKLAASLRAERINLDRKLFDRASLLRPGPSFSRVYSTVTGKIGLVYDVGSGATVYGHFATAADPVSTNLFLVRSGESFDLARGREAEIGVKQSLPGLRGEWTGSFFWIDRRNLLTQTSLTSAQPVGQQSSRGLEATIALRPISRWTVQANVAAVRARFDVFDETVGNQLVSRAGNRPFNVPPVVVSVWTSYRLTGHLPIDVGGSYRHVDDRFNTTDNFITMLGYGTADAFAAWSGARYRVTGRVRNLFNKDYAMWGDNFYPTQVLLGAPRSAEIVLNVKF